MKYLIIALFSLSAYSQHIPQCPPESLRVEYMSPVTGTKKSFCGYQKDGKTIKHGEELIFDSEGNVTKKIVFNHGMEQEAPSPSSNRGEKLTVSDEQLFLASIHELMEILTLNKANLGKGIFKVKSCDNRPIDWVKGAMLNSPINKSYIFNEACDVKGSFSASFTSEFPINFELRNLRDFNKTTMTVKMSISKARGIRYRFEVKEGLIASPARNANFNAEYEVDVDPMSGQALKGSQDGRIHLTKVDGKEVNATKKLVFEE